MRHSLKCRPLRAAEPFVFSAGRTPGRRMVGVSAVNHEQCLHEGARPHLVELAKLGPFGYEHHGVRAAQGLFERFRIGDLQMPRAGTVDGMQPRAAPPGKSIPEGSLRKLALRAANSSV